MQNEMTIATAQTRFSFVESRARLYNAHADAELAGRHHMTAAACFDLADLVRQGVQLYDSINSLDNDWRRLVFRGDAEFSEPLEKRIDALYRDWLATSRRILANHESVKREFGAGGFDTAIVAVLESAVREIGGATTPDREFFAGEALTILFDAAVDEFRAGRFETMTVLARLA